MREIAALEAEIMEALPRIDAAGDLSPGLISAAHDILCNSWRGPGERLDRLREIAAAFREAA